MEAANEIYRGRPLAFSINRFLRIVPTYLAALAFCFIALAITGTHPEAFSLYNFFANITAIVPLPGRWTPQPNFNVIGISWAIEVECAFYITVAGILFLRLTNLANIANAAGLILVAASTYFYFASPPWNPSLMSEVPFFTCGTAFYFILKGYRPAFFLLALSVPLSIIYAANLGMLLFVPLLFIAGVLAVAPSMAHKTDRKAGELSYPIYLGQWAPLLPFVHAAPPTMPWLILGCGLLLPFILYAGTEMGIKKTRDAVRKISFENL